MTANLNNYYDKITKYIAELSRRGYTLKEILEAVMKYEPDCDMKRLTNYVNERI